MADLNLKADQKLFYFTASYPFGIGEDWKKNELTVFSKNYDKIIISPFSYSGNLFSPKSVNDNVIVNKPLFKELSGLSKHILKIIFTSKIIYYVKEGFQKKVFFKKEWLVNWCIACIQTELILRSKQYKEILRIANKDDIFYFFWGREWAYVIPFFKKKGFKNIFFRVHGYDIYEEREMNHGYIPFRDQLFKATKSVIVLSNQAKQYLLEREPLLESKIHIAPLGTISNGVTKEVEDEVFHIISCSGIVSVKRLNLIVEALKFADFEIKWTHIGDGELRPQLEREINHLPKNVSVNLVGKLEPDLVSTYYLNNHIDLFINVSSSEGMPVSIMEAFAAAIPVIGTDVGGVNEMITSKNGFLIPKDIKPQELWNIISSFFKLNPYLRDLMSKEAFQTYEKKFQAINNANKLIGFIKNNSNNNC